MALELLTDGDGLNGGKSGEEGLNAAVELSLTLERGSVEVDGEGDVMDNPEPLVVEGVGNGADEGLPLLLTPGDELGPLLGAGKAPVQFELDREGSPVDGAAARLVSEGVVLTLSTDDGGEETLGDSLEESGLELSGVGVELGPLDDDMDGAVINAEELEPGTADEAVTSVLLVPESGDVFVLSENELDETNEPVERGGVGPLEDISLHVKSAYRSSFLDFVLVLTSSSRGLGLEQMMTQQSDLWSAR